MFISVSLTIAKKEDMVHMHTHMHTRIHTHTHTHDSPMKYYSAIKKNKILPFVTTWMDLKRSMSNGKRQILYYFTHRWNIKTKKRNNGTNKMKQ